MSYSSDYIASVMHVTVFDNTLQERRRAVEEVQGQGHAAAVHKKLDLSQSKVCDGATYIFSVTLIEGVVTD